MNYIVPEEHKTDVQKMFEDFQHTAFYRWLDSVISGRFKWLILPITGLVDAFVVILPTEAVVAMYMIRHPQASWWQHTLIVSFFAAIGYMLLALIVSSFGINAVDWLSVLMGQDLAQLVDTTIQEHVLLLGISAGVTSIFPMPATAFSVVGGLLGVPVLLLGIGVFLGKCVRFGVFAYGASRWGKKMVDYYFAHANIISLILVVLIVLYLYFV